MSSAQPEKHNQESISVKKRIAGLIITLLVSVSAAAGNLQLQSFFSSTTANLYLSYLSMGVIADSYTKKVYEKDQSITYVSSVVVQASIQKDYLQKMLSQGEIPESEHNFIRKMMTCFQLLIDGGASLIDYIKTGKNESFTAYNSKRNEAWAVIGAIMGL